jgi:O-acetylhomoserine (thiol)-lyase
MSGFGTRTVRGPDEEAPDAEGHVAPIFQTTAFTFPDVRAAVEAFREGGYTYSRKANPTVRALERHIAALESAPVDVGEGMLRAPEDTDARFFASGMAAISATILAIGTNRRVVCQSGIYGTTETMAGRLDGLGVQVDFVPVGDLQALEAAVSAGPPPRSCTSRAPRTRCFS